MKSRLYHFISSIKPDASGIVRTMKYEAAMAWRVANAVKRRVSGTGLKDAKEVLDFDDLEKICHSHIAHDVGSNSSKPKILLLGPYHFKQPMWSVRAKAALPDLISPLSEIAEIHWVTPIPTRAVLSSMLEIKKTHEFHHHLLPPDYNLKSHNEKAKVLDDLVQLIKPQIIMNAFGVIASGYDAVSCAKRHDIMSVLRIPGDELKARQKINEKNFDGYKADIDTRRVKFAIANADHVMVMSDSERHRVLREHPNKENVFVQIRGVDTHLFKPPENKDFHNTAINVGFVGRLTAEKGTDILLETAHKLNQNSAILFHVVSPEKVEANLVQKHSNIKWHGYLGHERIPAFLQQMDILILPSHMEGRSQTMIEAMSCGLPVLMQKHIHPEKLPGMIYCEAEASTFVNEIKKLENDRDHLGKLAIEARHSALKYFDKANWSEAMTTRFRTLLETR